MLSSLSLQLRKPCGALRRYFNFKVILTKSFRQFHYADGFDRSFCGPVPVLTNQNISAIIWERKQQEIPYENTLFNSFNFYVSLLTQPPTSRPNADADGDTDQYPYCDAYEYSYYNTHTNRDAYCNAHPAALADVSPRCTAYGAERIPGLEYGGAFLVL
jgi:hypothetical protein